MNILFFSFAQHSSLLQAHGVVVRTVYWVLCKGPDSLNHLISEVLLSLGVPSGLQSLQNEGVFQFVSFSFFKHLSFCQCCDIIAKTSKMFGRVASACLTEQPLKLEISLNLRLFKSSGCGARYKESWVKPPARSGCLELSSPRALLPPSCPE